MLPKLCFTASAFLIYQDKVLLVKHKKLHQWLSPGGHIDEGELPHQAAQREFLEETGLKVKICSAYQTTNQPLPLAINEHFVCEENYHRRLLALEKKEVFTPEKMWSKGCEKHSNFSYLAKLDGPLLIKPAEGESQEVSWFSLAELKGRYKQDLANSVLEEAELAFELAKSKHS